MLGAGRTTDAITLRCLVVGLLSGARQRLRRSPREAEGGA
jgi:hypothetical protein